MSARGEATPDFLVLGAGIAGLRAALALARSGRVLVLTKGALSESNAEYVQGGIAAALGDDDKVALHFQDTLRAGDGLCREEAVKVLVEEGPQQIEQLMAWGMKFDRNGPSLARAREGAHSRSRILHAHGDSTGAEIVRVLLAKAQQEKNIRFHPHALAVDLLLRGGRAEGVSYLGRESGEVRTIEAKALLLATGGLGRVYKETTNPAAASGDGVAMAYRAGAQLSDLEFVQFHPTAMCVKSAPRFLLPEVLRSEGGFLRDIMLERFMPRHHEAAELAPRDVVARAIIMEMRRTRSEFVYLDLTHLDEAHLKKRFPAIYETCLRYNLDITADLIPVRPAAHYAMGGASTDIHGATTLPGLFAAGEVAASGVHGANRWASNSLLEGLVFGARAAEAIASGHSAAVAKTAPERPSHAPSPTAAGDTKSCCPPEALIEQVRAILWNQVGIIRTGAGLLEAVTRLESLKLREQVPPDACAIEARNALIIGRIIAHSALARKESCGAHYRSDFPLKREGQTPLHSYVSKDTPVFFSP